MSYTVIDSSNKHRKNILENKTKQVIYLEITRVYANKVCRKLNLGAGFKEFTPEFMTRSFNVQYKNRIHN